MKNISEFTEKECKILFEKIVVNANRHWDTALFMSKNGYYNNAIKDLIISNEELIKSIIIIFDTKGFEFRKVEGMDKIITRSHTIRHFISFFMFIMNIVGEDLFTFIKNNRNDSHFIINLLKDNVKREALFEKYFLNKIPFIKEEYLWFKGIEQYRQQASHVDIKDDIISPQDMTSEDYNEVYKRMRRVRFAGLEFIDILQNDKNLTDELENIKNDFITKDWYKEVASTIKMTNRGNPFKAFEKNFNDFDINSILNETKKTT